MVRISAWWASLRVDFRCAVVRTNYGSLLCIGSQWSLKAGSLSFSYLNIDENCQQRTSPKRKLWKKCNSIWIYMYIKKTCLVTFKKFNYSILIRLNLNCVKLKVLISVYLAQKCNYLRLPPKCIVRIFFKWSKPLNGYRDMHKTRALTANTLSLRVERSWTL
jgi:hypothetical protein